MLEETLDGFAVPLIQTAEVAQREHTANSGKPFFFQMFPNGIAGEEERRFGVVYDMMDIIGVEVLQNGDYDTTVGDGGHIGDAPAGIVLPMTAILSPRRSWQYLKIRCSLAISCATSP